MRFVDYLASKAADILLCMLMAVGLGLNVMQGFHIADEIAQSWLLAATVVAAPIFAAFCVSYEKVPRGAQVAVLVAGVLAAHILLAQVASTPLFEDSYANSALAYLVLLYVACAVMLLSARRAGIVVEFAAGCIVCGAIQFLYGKDLVVPTAVFMVACVACYFHRSMGFPGEAFSRSGKSASTAVRALNPLRVSGAAQRSEAGQTPNIERPLAAVSADRDPDGPGSVALRRALLARMATAMGLPVAALGVAILVFFGIVVPLNPPAHELKLITEYYSLEEVHVTGVLSFLHQRDEGTTSSDLNDQERESSQLGDASQDAEGQGSSNPDGEDERMGDGSFNPIGLGDPLSVVRYLQQHWWVGFIVLVALLLAWAIVVFARRALRKRRLARWREQGLRGEFLLAYRHAATVLETAGMIECGAKTPGELACMNSIPSEFAPLCETFSQVSYGASDPSEEDVRSAERFVESLPKHLIAALGRIRYIKHFFRA